MSPERSEAGPTQARSTNCIEKIATSDSSRECNPTVANPLELADRIFGPDGAPTARLCAGCGRTNHYPDSRFCDRCRCECVSLHSKQRCRYQGKWWHHRGGWWTCTRHRARLFRTPQQEFARRVTQAIVAQDRSALEQLRRGAR
jgi:hypothetical protein